MRKPARRIVAGEDWPIALYQRVSREKVGKGKGMGSRGKALPEKAKTQRTGLKRLSCSTITRG
jgi:hypothetical protein